MTDADRIRGLEETVQAQVQRLAELGKLRDAAHGAKVHLIGEHAAERAKRQTAEVAIVDARSVIAGLRNALSSDVPVNGAELHALIERADAWLEAHPEVS